MSTSNVIRPGGRSRPGRLMALLTATAVAASLLSAPSGPASAVPSLAPAPGPDAPSGLPAADIEPVAVTLITGDTVYWQDSGDGNPRVAEIEEAPRDYPVTFDQSGTQEDFYVIPTDVMEYVVAGTVDRELFNIPGLVRQGLADAVTDELPVIVTFDQNRSPRQLTREANALPAASDATAVERVNGAGVKVKRGNAGTFRQALFGKPGRDRSARIAGARGLDGAVEQVMLDQMLKIDLAESVPQIGAPQAWDAGYTGEGITVAVLDTGIDPHHPDLAGQVMAAENFTDEPDTTDNHGHGTHVASTIAGTGAASDGARIGVAPEADLLIGKVCTTDGRCNTSWVMAGMEWAATHGVDIVNMSLGGGPTDGADPLSQLVNDLSAETGTLFVTSAGNLGCSPSRGRIQRVGSPAVATAALAVGAVDKSNRLASFSSCGPRVGDHAVKPEITAPGVGIVAARAEGTSAGRPVDDHYTSLNGTSMASPHVAGAAALLAQATGLTGGKLKDALVSTAADGGFRWFEQGTGRIDVPAALESPVFGQGTVNFGGIDGQASKDLVYSNRSDSDITLSLEAAATDLNGQPHSGVALSTDTLIVPGHGNATVTVTVTPPESLTGKGPHGGAITATGPDDVVLRTAIGFGPSLHRVTIEVLDSNGGRIGSDVATDSAISLIRDTWDQEAGGPAVYKFNTNEGIATGHIPAGTYTMITFANEHRQGTPLDGTRTTLLVEVEVEIDTDTSIVLDARNAVLVKQPEVPRKADKRNHGVMVIRELAGSDGTAFTSWLLGDGWPTYVTPAVPGELAAISLFVSWTLAEPQALKPLPWDNAQRCPIRPTRCYSDTPGYVYNLPFLYENGIPEDMHERITRRDLVEVPSRFHSDHPDAFIRQKFESMPAASPSGGVMREIWFRPGAVTEYLLADDRFTWKRAARIERRPEGGPAQAVIEYSWDRFPAAEAGSRRAEERWHEAPFRIGMWDVREETLHNPMSIRHWAAGSRNGPDADQFIVPFQVMGNVRGHGSDANAALASWRMWNADTGIELERTGLLVPLPRGTATYRLEQTVHLPPTLPYLTGQDVTTWTFTSRPSNAHVPELYKCRVAQTDLCQIQPLIRLEYDLDLDIHNRTWAGRAHRFTVTAGHHSKAIDRAPVASLRVRASFDDGATWRDARVTGGAKDTWDTGGLLPSTEPYQQFRVVLAVPPLHRTTGFVTLRVQATDANGGTVDQVIHNAYLLK